MSERLDSNLVVIVGPTGAGKSELAIRIAKEIGGEIVSADSRQVYRGMDIGTGKTTASEREQVPHHILDVVEPDDEMTAARFVALADSAIFDIASRGRAAIVAGGTMLYVRALLHGLFQGPPADSSLRARLEDLADIEGTVALWRILEACDRESAARIHDTDRRRLIRAIEVFRLTGIPLSEHHRHHKLQQPRYQFRFVGVRPPRLVLHKKINDRVLTMVDRGLVAEVVRLRALGFGPELRSQQAIGYAEMHSHVAGEVSLVETIENIQRNSRRYARRQLSWYRGYSNVVWHEEVNTVDLQALRRYVSQWKP